VRHYLPDPVSEADLNRIAEAGKQFRRVNAHLHLPTLRSALECQTAEPVGPVVHNDEVSAA
jgi:hypothetical protein